MLPLPGIWNRDRMKKRRKADERKADWRSMLRAIPIQNAAAQAEPLHDGTLRMVVPRRRPKFLVPPISWILRPSTSRTIILDRLGGHVWELCDDRRNVEQVVDAFAAAHQLTFHEARVAVGNYIRQLIERGALAIAMSDPSR